MTTLEGGFAPGGRRPRGTAW